MNDVKCPVCESKTNIIDSRETPYFTVFRTHECPTCLTRFKTDEKIMFQTLPKYIKDNFINYGVRGKGFM